MCSHGYDRHITKWVTFWKESFAAQRGKTCISIITVSKEGKAEKGVQWCVVMGLTPCYGDSYGLVFSLSVSRHKHAETNGLLSKRQLCQQAWEARDPAESNCRLIIIIISSSSSFVFLLLQVLMFKIL